MKIMVNDKVVSYIKESLQKGVNKEVIKTALIKTGWKIEDINEAFTRVIPTSNQVNSTDQNDIKDNEIYPRILIEKLTEPNRFLNFPIFGFYFKMLITIPLTIFFWFYWMIFLISAFLINPWVVLFTGHCWQAAYNAIMRAFRYNLKIVFYWYGLTDKYPGISTQINDKFSLEIDCPKTSSRLLNMPLFGIFIKEILLIPAFFYWGIIMYASVIGAIVAGFCIFITKTYPQSIFELITDGTRGLFSMGFYLTGMSDKYPSFKISMKNATKKIILIILALLLMFASNLGINAMVKKATIYKTTPLFDSDNVIITDKVLSVLTPTSYVSSTSDPCKDINNNLLERHKQDYDSCLKSTDTITSNCSSPSRFSDSFKEDLNIIIILDSSGSMIETVSGEQKIQIAKDVISNFVKGNLPERTKIGLMVYGHKGSNSVSQKSLSCSGIEMIYPLSKLNTSSFTTAVNSFKATGWTPIAGSLEKAKEVFSQYDGETNSNLVYLISDGIETCDGDPVSVAKELNQSNIKAIINIVGFNVDNQAQQQLQAVSAAGGGEYYKANTSEEMNTVFYNQKKYLEEITEYKKCIQTSATENKKEIQTIATEVKKCIQTKANAEKKGVQKDVDIIRNEKKIDYVCWNSIYHGAHSKWREIFNGAHNDWREIYNGAHSDWSKNYYGTKANTN